MRNRLLQPFYKSLKNMKKHQITIANNQNTCVPHVHFTSTHEKTLQSTVIAEPHRAE